MDIFSASGGGASESPAGAPLESTLAALYARGRAVHDELDVDDESFVMHLVRCRAPVTRTGSAIHAEDLYLACACLLSKTPALARLLELCRPTIRRYLSRIRDAKAIVEEVEQRLWDVLVVGQLPKLATYAGRGPLGAWIGITAQRLALMELRHERAERRARHDSASSERPATESPELAVIKRRFQAQFQRAVAAGFETLDDHQRLLYRMRLVDGLSLEAIARARGVHAVTVGRWFEAARQQVLEDAKRRLVHESRMAGDEFESLAGMLVSHLDLSSSVARMTA